MQQQLYDSIVWDKVTQNIVIIYNNDHLQILLRKVMDYKIKYTIYSFGSLCKSHGYINCYSFLSGTSILI